jgi:hypothetical protein
MNEPKAPIHTGRCVAVEPGASFAALTDPHITPGAIAAYLTT